MKHAVAEVPISEAAHSQLQKLWDHLQEKPTQPTRPQFYPVDVERLIALNGWEVIGTAGAYFPDPTKKLDAYADFSRRAVVLTDPDLSSERKRYTLAHELGHVLLHEALLGSESSTSTIGRAVSYRPVGSRRERTVYSRLEAEANQFAAELLMPERAVRRVFKELFGVSRVFRAEPRAADLFHRATGLRARVDLSQKELAEALADYSHGQASGTLCSRFGVSRTAMRKRLISLGLVS